MSRQNAGNKLDRAMTTTTRATTMTTTSSIMVLFTMVFVLLTAGQACVEAFVGLHSPLPFARQRRGCSLVVSFSQKEQQQADPPENVFAASTTIVENQNDIEDETDDSWKTGFGKKVEYLSLTLKQHKPLGCTVEESLSSSSSTVSSSTTTTTTTTKQKQKKTAAVNHYVFVTKVVDGGNAAKAGILTGDVIIGVTATFGQAVENVAGMGIDKVKSLVAARPKNEPLHLRIARGTSVVQEHEVALAELCSNGAANDVEIENCVLEYLQSGYDINNNSNKNAAVDENEQQEECDPATDEDCLLDQMYSMWADDMSVPPSSNGKTASSSSSLDQASPKKQVKPWSSRSSPSGTWVRDPKTGEMRNIDA